MLRPDQSGARARRASPRCRPRPPAGQVFRRCLAEGPHRIVLVPVSQPIPMVRCRRRPSPPSRRRTERGRYWSQPRRVAARAPDITDALCHPPEEVAARVFPIEILLIDDFHVSIRDLSGVEGRDRGKQSATRTLRDVIVLSQGRGRAPELFRRHPTVDVGRMAQVHPVVTAERASGRDEWAPRPSALLLAPHG